MIFLFSSSKGPLKDGADFMKTKRLFLHPGNPEFYLIKQQAPLHTCVGDLKPDSRFDGVNCKLADGEAAIVIGHGGTEPKLYDEAKKDVTEAALRLLAKIAQDNTRTKSFTVFLAACGGGKKQPGQQMSLLATLIRDTPALAERLLKRTISSGSYTASAGLVQIGPPAVPGDRAGTHIYGSLEDSRGVEQHCGYDARITVELERDSNGTYVTVFFAPALYPMADVNRWAQGGFRPPMPEAFPKLYDTLARTS